MTTSHKNRNKKGGFIAYYNNVASPNDYMLNSDIPTTLTSSTATIAPVTQPPNVYVPPNGDATAAPATYPTWDPSSLNLYPNITGGKGSKACLTRDCDAFEFDNSRSFLYSLKGGCACNASSLMGGNDHKERRYRDRDVKDERKGGDFVITPFITAISLLAARLLADKNGPFPMVGGNEKQRRRIAKNRN